MRKNFFLLVIQLFFIVALPAATLFFGAYFYNHFTDGFNVHQITSSVSHELFLPTPSLEKNKKKEILSILNQPFYYLGKGCQFYAFESDCGKYVLKIVKQKHLRGQDPWLSHLRLPSILAKRVEKIKLKKKLHTKALFEGYKLAFNEFSEESGLMFYHFNHEPFLGQHITLYDRIGLANPIYLDDYEFVIQKRAVLIKEIFPKLLKNNDETAIREKLEEIKVALIDRMQKGMGDRDRSFVHNIAFSATENKAIFIDVGELFKETTIKSEIETKKELLRRMSNFRSWAEEHMPKLVVYIDDEITKLNNS